MLQALLLLAVVIGFLPIFVDKINRDKQNRENVVVAAQATAAFSAAHAFVRNEYDNFPDGIKVLSGDEFTDTLEPFGLPLGFIPKTALGQSISLIISKDGQELFSVIRISAGKLPALRRAEILTRIGFWGVVTDGENSAVGATGGWRMTALPNDLLLDSSDIYIRVPEDEEFSVLVSRKSKKPEKNMFQTNLKMDGNDIVSVGKLSSETGEVKNVAAVDFVLSGIEVDKKNKNNIGGIHTQKAIFQSKDGNPLTITRSGLTTGTLSATSIASYGTLPALTTGLLDVQDFNMTAGRTGFTGPAHWDIKTGASFSGIILSLERLSINSFLDTSRGQDVFLDDTGTDVEYTYGSGIHADVIKTDNIVLRDQISSELLEGGTGAAILEIRPAGTSVLPDVLLDGIDNGALKIPIDAKDLTGKLDSCRNIIEKNGGKYNTASLANSIICQFVMFNRIEERLIIKQCLNSGGANCI